MKLSFFGADQCVTGSCHCLEVNGKKILIDCGLQQGRDEIDNQALPFHPGSIDYVLVTHAHIDHSGAFLDGGGGASLQARRGHRLREAGRDDGDPRCVEQVFFVRPDADRLVALLEYHSRQYAGGDPSG